MLQTRKRYPLIEMPPENKIYGLIIVASCWAREFDGEERFFCIPTDPLYEVYSAVKGLFSDGEGYPVFLHFATNRDSRTLPLKHCFVPYRASGSTTRRWTP